MEIQRLFAQPALRRPLRQYFFPIGAASRFQQAWSRRAGWACLPILVLLAGCFHKDVMTDTADDVIATVLYQGPEGKLIISKESIFQANSKESGGGVTHISGYTEMRLSCYRIATGDLVARVELGDMIDDADDLLGFSPGKIWMYSIDPEIGLHYRDPLTLEVKEAWPQLSQRLGLNTFHPAHPEWALINQFFAYDWNEDKVLLTDEAGFKYALDPNSFALDKVEQDMPRTEWDEHIQNQSGQFVSDRTAYLEGDPRKIISYLDKKSSGDISFLMGAWVIDKDPFAAGKRLKAMRDGLSRHLKDLQDSLVAFSASHPEANQEPDWSTWTFEQRRLHDHADQLRRAIDDTKRDQVDWARSYKKVLDYPLLTTDQHSAYLLQASMIADTAHTILSRVNLAADSTWSLAWSTHLQGIYHDHNKADLAGAFEIVYSKGNPEFDYEWACTDGEYIVLILQLHMLAIEVKTGKLLWNKEI